MSEQTPAIEDEGPYDLGNFAEELFGTPSTEEPTHEEETEETETEEEVEETEAEETDDGLAPEEEEEEEEEAEEAPEPKKTRFQKRIDQLSENARLAKEEAAAERQARLALEERLAKLEAGGDKPKADTPVKKDADAPTPEDLGEDGEPKYPLGEYDPSYIRDITRYELKAQLAAEKARMAEEAEQAKIAAAKIELQQEWNSKLDTARERYPDFQAKGEELVSVFGDLDPAYGEYLSSTLMGMEYGPDVLYYLANNLEVAKDIVSKGAIGATLALGSIEASFGEKPKARPKTTKAAPPPPRNKGSAVAAPSVPLDTDDLEAFRRELFRTT